MDTREKIVSAAQMERRFSPANSSGAAAPVVAKGQFDILRPEHGRRLGEAREPGAALVVIVLADQNPRRAVLDQQSRAELAAGLEAADAVIICDETEADAVARSWGARRVVDIDQPPLPDLTAEVLRRQGSDGNTP